MSYASDLWNCLFCLPMIYLVQSNDGGELVGFCRIWDTHICRRRASIYHRNCNIFGKMDRFFNYMKMFTEIPQITLFFQSCLARFYGISVVLPCFHLLCLFVPFLCDGEQIGMAWQKWNSHIDVTFTICLWVAE